MAEESLESLGYPLKEKPSILDRVEPPVESFAPLADPLDDMEVLSAEPEAPLEVELTLEPVAEEPLSLDLADDFSAEFACLDSTAIDASSSDAKWASEAPSAKLELIDFSIDLPDADPPPAG